MRKGEQKHRKVRYRSKGGQGLRTAMPHRPVTVTYICVCATYGKQNCRVEGHAES